MFAFDFAINNYLNFGDEMLQFVFGKPNSGKTSYLLNKIKDLAEKNSESILIVPEQYTFESERTVLRLLGDEKSSKVKVLSFSRLVDEVNRFTGGLVSRDLGESDKVIFMKRALLSVKDELTLWGKYSDSISFAKTMLDTIGEFKINSITPENLRETAAACNKATLKYKLEDIARIYETYNLLLGEKFIDPADKLTKLYNKLSSFRYFENKTVFIDSFKGFTGQQYKLLERIINQAESLYIAFTYNPENNKNFNIFTNIRLAIERIEKIAKSNNKRILVPVVFSKSSFSAPDIIKLEKVLEGENVFSDEITQNIKICEASTIFDEAQFTARTIRKLVRTKNYRFKDFVIIVRDAEIYKEAIISACLANDVAVFYDNRMPLSSFPLSVASFAAVRALKLSTENILRFHKTGLGTLNTEEISALENYCYLWNIDTTQWLEDWTMNPKGLTSDINDNSDELENLNLLRKKAIKPLLNFKENFKGSASDMARALVELFESCNVGDKLIDLSERFVADGNIFSSDSLKQSYGAFMRILDSLVVCFGEESIKPQEFFDALELAVASTDIGVVPQTLDEVTFGSADRIRPSMPKITFILGANQGIFPMNASSLGLFNITERRNLIDNGIEIADNSIYSSIDEDYLVYCNLCSASEKVYISYHNQSISGEKCEPSAFVATISKSLNPEILYEPDENLNLSNCPETMTSALSEYSIRRKENSPQSNAVKRALNASEMAEKAEFIDDFCKEKEYFLNCDTAILLFGNKIRMSASKFDTFNRCRFSFFLKYGLNAKKIQPAEFDVLQRGTIVHYVLERFITDYKENYSGLSDNELDILTDKYIEEYLGLVAGFENIRNTRIEFLISRISRSLKDVVRHVCAELSQSSFEPKKCELKIGNGEEIETIKFPFDNGEIGLVGSIDRVDEYNGYIRIIDYKTGSKSFKLPDILFGLNLQMLIYLYAVTRGNGLDDSAAAGILYQPSSRDIKDEGLAMNGLLPADINLIKAMDKNAAGEFVPKPYILKDNSISKRGSYIDASNFTEIFDYIEKLMKKTGNLITSGDIRISPLDGRESPACKYCDFASVCRIENKSVPRVENLSNEKVFEIMKEAEADGI